MTCLRWPTLYVHFNGDLPTWISMQHMQVQSKWNKRKKGAVLQWSVVTIITYIYPSLTYFNINFPRVNSSRYKARPVHIDSHDILSVGREAGHIGGVLKGRPNLYQIVIRIRYSNVWIYIATVTRSLPVVDAEGTDVVRAVVAIHNVPGKGDVGAVPVGYLEVANNILGICKCLTQTSSVCADACMICLNWHWHPETCLTCECSTQQESCCHNEQEMEGHHL